MFARGRSVRGGVCECVSAACACDKTVVVGVL